MQHQNVVILIVREIFFTKGVKWADSHLSEELVRRLYSASIAIYKLGRCKSDNEAILYIKERFKL